LIVPYLLDADTLISAHRQYYPFDFCPGFWTWLEKNTAKGASPALMPFMKNCNRAMMNCPNGPVG